MSQSLFFEDHLHFFRTLFAVKGDTSELVLRKAWLNHSFVILNPLQDLSTKAMIAAEQLKSNDAKNFLKYGAGRRLLAIWYSYRSITQMAHAERIEPLTEAEAHELNKDINLMYMHLRGVLDNYAWAYCYENEKNLLQDRKGNERKFIGLFNSDFPKESKNKELWTELDAYRCWATELSNKRDPVAHRIPLCIVPSYITPDQNAEFQALQNDSDDALQQHDFQKVQMIAQKQRSVGRFPMVFAHSPDEDPIPIYPTIPGDMVNLILIQEIILRHLK
jgi:hypothetical protein